MRTHDIRYRDRQSSPECDQHSVFRVERIVFRDVRAAVQTIFIRQRRRLESPVLLEGERPGLPLAPAKVEYMQAALAGPPQQLPVLEVIRGQVARRLDVAGVIRQYFVTKIEAQHARDGLAIRFGDREYFAVPAKGAMQRFEIALRQRWRSMPMHAVRVEFEEMGRVGVDLADQATCNTLANHRPL